MATIARLPGVADPGQPPGAPGGTGVMAGDADDDAVVAGARASGDGVLRVDVDGFEGPLDALLALARAQKVDLRQISILRLADQYLAFIADARRADLDLAASYLVMAAWLAELKSRLLLPDPPDDGEPSGEVMAEALAFQLRRLEAMRRLGERLMQRPRLGREVFARGAPERLEPEPRCIVEVTLFDLLRAYGARLARQQVAVMRIEPAELVSVEVALQWLRTVLGRAPGWESLESVLPPGTLDGLRHGRLEARSALAAAFSASLELVRAGDARLRQLATFGPILLAAAVREERRRPADGGR